MDGEQLNQKEATGRLSDVLEEVNKDRTANGMGTIMQQVWKDVEPPGGVIIRIQAIPVKENYVCVFTLSLDQQQERQTNRTNCEPLMSAVVRKLLLNMGDFADTMLNGTEILDTESQLFIVQSMYCLMEGLYEDKMGLSPRGQQNRDLSTWIYSVLKDSNGEECESVRYFLINFRYYISPANLMNSLALRLMLALSMHTPESRKSVNQIDVTRIVNFLRQWIPHHPYDVTDQTLSIANKILALTPSPGAPDTFGSILSLDIGFLKPNSLKRPSRDEERPIIKDRVFDYDSAEIARQFTLLSQRRFCSVECIELTQQKWSNRDTDTSLNVQSLIDHCNKMTSYVNSCIVTMEDRGDRSEILQTFIEVADECLNHHDYETAFIISIALSQSSISRLKKSWKRIDEKARRKWIKVTEATDASFNYKSYRNTLRALYADPNTRNTPVIPYIAITLRDITFIEENPLYKERLYINDVSLRHILRAENAKDRIRLMGQTISEIFHYQKHCHSFFTNIHLQTLIHNGIHAAWMNEKEIYEQSKRVVRKIFKILLTSAKEDILSAPSQAQMFENRMGTIKRRSSLGIALSGLVRKVSLDEHSPRKSSSASNSRAESPTLGSPRSSGGKPRSPRVSTSSELPTLSFSSTTTSHTTHVAMDIDGTYERSVLNNIRAFFWTSALLQFAFSGPIIYLTATTHEPFPGLSEMVTVMMLSAFAAYSSLSALIATEPRRRFYKLLATMEFPVLLMMAWTAAHLFLTQPFSILQVVAAFAGFSALSFRLGGWYVIIKDNMAYEKSSLPLRYSEMSSGESYSEGFTALVSEEQRGKQSVTYQFKPQTYVYLPEFAVQQPLPSIHL
ncbi:hypothetical protein PROFUN_14156 [Planoprotostelium fungivorum]|uniref:Uncharacterized protein n=1 Tax=Planoprotostelium fungivorum TaxID=1890364 RepID=A0A2P6N1L6_9EUKA|nr:hypothetical protein PROFUN_14156 [Planoprotostelium fungivorum]